ncbi:MULTISPECIES: dynamin family protein [Bacillus cereus group]|uniref:dynamin family protein n=1 Tax=Bacillus cereus group TaxID=86661 RepID=UPI002D7690E3|nr:dynamin family protein [Bacillus paranthracis]
MNTRNEWNEHVENLNRSFEKALALTKETEEYFGDYVMLDEDRAVLNTQLKNWKDNRFEIVVVGEFSTGKSTFINALLRKNVLPSKVTPTTATINFIKHVEQGDGTEKAVINFFNGSKIESSFDQLEKYVTEMSEEHNVVEEISHVDIFVDSKYLTEGVVIVDTPGLQALHPEHERITKKQIKKSNASVLLFNMEQPGKRSEFMFLQDLSDSIDRIFFVGNRMDGVPDNEISDVVTALESSLKDNNYQSIPEEYAKVFPISALQALKGRDENTITKRWQGWSSEALIESSRFAEFESRLEEYLFHGEKAKDVIRAPYSALSNFYEQLQNKMNQIEVLISGEIGIEVLQKEKERLAEEVELRKLQLQDQERNLKNLFQDVVYEHEKDFNERKEREKQFFVEQISEMELIEDLEDEAPNIMNNLNKSFQRLVDQGLNDLSNQLEMQMRREIIDFEVSIEEYSNHKIESLTSAEIKVETNLETENSQTDIKFVNDQFSEEAAALEEQRELLKQKQKLECELDGLKSKEKLMKSQYQRREDFFNTLLQSTDATRQEYGVIKRRRFLWDKKGMVDVPNEEYARRLKEKEELMNKNRDEERKILASESQLESELALNESEFETTQDYFEARKELKKRKEEERIKRLGERTKLEERRLSREKKKVIREIEDVFEGLRREYRSLLRGLDALALARQEIEGYIQNKDIELNIKLKDLDSKEKLLQENTQKQEVYRQNLEVVRTKAEQEKENVVNLLVEAY